jgi:hypothetical protein
MLEIQLNVIGHLYRKEHESNLEDTPFSRTSIDLSRWTACISAVFVRMICCHATAVSRHPIQKLMALRYPATSSHQSR